MKSLSQSIQNKNQQLKIFRRENPEFHKPIIFLVVIYSMLGWYNLTDDRYTLWLINFLIRDGIRVLFAVTIIYIGGINMQTVLFFILALLCFPVDIADIYFGDEYDNVSLPKIIIHIYLFLSIGSELIKGRSNG